MEKLYQEIQDQINELMTSKLAKSSDNQLLRYESQSVVDSAIGKLLIDGYQSGESLAVLGKKYSISVTTIGKYLKSQKIHVRTKNTVAGVTLDDKLSDVKNGMGVHEYCAKWKVGKSGYYRLKKRHKIS
jgi:uncharacterized protein YaaW (UPF0174 family)